MVLFDFALDHLTRIHRVLRMPQGHCLVIGVGGSGKATLIRLAAYTAECGVYEIMLARGYNETAFREDLKVTLLLQLLVGYYSNCCIVNLLISFLSGRNHTTNIC